MIYTTLIIMTLFMSCEKENYTDPMSTEILYTMPEESELHEGTWLQWPHHYQYGIAYRNSLDATWVSMTKELVSSENVHIIAYNQTEKDRIILALVIASEMQPEILNQLLPANHTDNNH